MLLFTLIVQTWYMTMWIIQVDVSMVVLVLIFRRSVINSNHGNRFLFPRGLILTIEVLNLDKGKCIFEINPTCAYFLTLALKKIWHTWKPINTCDLNLIQTYLWIILVFSSLVWLAQVGRKFVEIDFHKSKIPRFEARISVFRVLSLSHSHVMEKFQLHP